jgi:creatinine amidohydrolase
MSARLRDLTWVFALGLASALQAAPAAPARPAQAPKAALTTRLAPEPSTRELERINWMELREWVPVRSTTVLLPLGTLEPHGVTANGADIIAPVAIARALAPRLNAFIAPVVPYGVTGAMDAYPGSFTIPEDAYREYVRAVLVGLARNGFRNLILINGHGGKQTTVLSALVEEVGRAERARGLSVNWWSYCSDVTLEVFGQDGGHAGNNETAFMQAIDPTLVHPERYTGPELTSANPQPGTWSAYPFPSSIGLYKDGQGYPSFDAEQARRYFDKVNDKLGRLIEDTIRKWDLAGL